MMFMKRWHINGVGVFDPSAKYATVERVRKWRRCRRDEVPAQTAWAWTSDDYPFKEGCRYTVNLVTGEVSHAHITTKRIRLEYR